MRVAILDRRLEAVAGAQGLTLRPPGSQPCPQDGFTVASYTTGMISGSALYSPYWDGQTWSARIWQPVWTVGRLSAFRMGSDGSQKWNQIGMPQVTKQLSPSAWVPGANLAIESNVKAVAMWDRPLTDAQIVRLFASAVPTY